MIPAGAKPLLAMANEIPTHLEPSELGTKEYWDNLYINEISNHAHDPEDKGTVWFDDSDAEAKMIEFLRRLDPNAEQDSDDDEHGDDDEQIDEQIRAPTGEILLLSQESTTFLDLGTGNGSLLFGLRDSGWRGQMLGVDYSPKSVEFARQILQSRKQEEEQEEEQEEAQAEGGEGGNDNIDFKEYDILNGQPSTISPSSANKEWDVILDKGTFDAISLYSSSSTEREEAQQQRRPNEGYKSSVLPLVREGGLFLITSCNWTEEELSKWFEGDHEGDSDMAWKFKQVGRVKYPTFSFGGVKGQTISTLCFMKVRR